MKRKAAILVVALCAIGAVAIAVRAYQRPVVGDWQSQAAFEQSGVRMRLKHVALRPWSEPLPDATLDLWARSFGQRPALERHYLYVEFGIHVDGEPLRDVPEERVRSLGPTRIQYDGQAVVSSGTQSFHNGTDRDSLVHLWHEVTPWKRGFGPGKIVVGERVNLDSGQSVEFEFRLPVE